MWQIRKPKDEATPEETAERTEQERRLMTVGDAGAFATQDLHTDLKVELHQRLLDVPTDDVDGPPLPHQQQRDGVGHPDVRGPLDRLRDQPRPGLLERRPRHHRMLHDEQAHEQQVDRRRLRRRATCGAVNRLGQDHPADERRQNRTLREALDELVGHVRDISRRAPHMTPAELDYAQDRLEWMTDEVWRLAVEGEQGERAG